MVRSGAVDIVIVDSVAALVVWIEDARSIEQKMQLIRQQELAGRAG